MGQKLELWQRPGLETTAGDHEKRIVRLERNSGVDLSDYIRFNFLNGNETPPNNWFSLHTTDPMPVLGWGMYLLDTSGGGIRLFANGGDINMLADNAVSIRGVASVGITSDVGINIDSEGAVDITSSYNMTISGEDVNINGSQTTFVGARFVTLIQSSDAEVIVSTGTSFDVLANSSLGGLGLRVDAFGHIFMPELPTADPATGDGQLWRDPVTNHLIVST